jgi:uncharacterized protein YbjQ (UPF0145 family)
VTTLQAAYAAGQSIVLTEGDGPVEITDTSQNSAASDGITVTKTAVAGAAVKATNQQTGATNFAFQGLGKVLLQAPASTQTGNYGLDLEPMRSETQGTREVALAIRLNDTTNALGADAVIVTVDGDPNGQVTAGNPGSIAIDVAGGNVHRKTTNPSTWEILGAGASGLVSTAQKTANYTLAVDDLAHYDPSGGTFTLTLPATPSANDRCAIHNDTADLTAITVAGNGSNVLDPVALVLGASFTYGGFEARHSTLVFRYTGTVWIVE